MKHKEAQAVTQSVPGSAGGSRDNGQQSGGDRQQPGGDRQDTHPAGERQESSGTAGDRAQKSLKFLYIF